MTFVQTMNFKQTLLQIAFNRMRARQNGVQLSSSRKTGKTQDDEFDVATATTVEEAKELAATGFEHFTTMKGVQIFRKPKMFQKYTY